MTSDRPDVLLVLADQWRGQEQGWRGNPEVSTPHLDALAAAGVAVPGARANHPVCGPSRGTLLTGRLAHRHGVVANDLPLAEDVPTLGTALRDAGYRTGWIGKWHLEGLPRDAGVRPGRRGFDWFATTNCSHRYTDAHYYTGSGPDRVDFTGYEPEVQTALARDFLDARDERPTFLVVSYGPPHDPYPDVPDRYLRRHDPSRQTPRPNAPDDPDARQRLAWYRAGINAVDDQLGVLVAHLRQRGRLDDTLLVVTADHGDMLGSHGRRAKQVPHAEAVDVPLVWHWPSGLAAREAGPGLFGLLDLTPTLLDLVGVVPLPGTDGRSLAAGLRSGAPLREAVLLANLVSVDEGWRQGVGEWRGYVDASTTFARHVDGTPWLLFDDVADPYQQTNLVDRDPTALAAAQARLDGLLAETDDPGLAAEPLIRRLGLVAEWNAREREMHGDEARLLAEAAA